MKKYFILAAVFALFAVQAAGSPGPIGEGVTGGFAVSAGLCIVAAAIVERRESAE